MGERFLLEQLSWEVPYDTALKKLRVLDDDREDFEEIYEKTLGLIKPVYYLGRESVQKNDGDHVIIGGVEFASRVISVNLQKAGAQTVYPFVGTSGRAAYEYAKSLDDELYRYWADMLCEMALRSAGASFKKYMQEFLGTKKIYSLAPGSVVDWPISQQAPLFELLGNVYDKTGILLEKSFLMRPVKSGSGIMYVSEHGFESCQLCPKIDCPNRRAKYDPEMLKREYGI